MSAAALPRRLAEAFGLSSLEDLHWDDLEALIGLAESDDLEVKSANYRNGDSDRRELAADVAAFANATGGLLVIGASESKEVITEIVPVRIAGEELRIRQVLANLVSPSLEVSTRVLPSKSDPAAGIVLINVQRSVRAPHAVAVNSDLRYVVRDGPLKRPMREAETASRYQDRFSTAAERLDRLDVLHRQIQRRVALDDNRAWLVVSGLPEIPGYGKSSSAELNATREWLRACVAETPLSSQLRDLADFATTGYGRYVSGDYSLREAGQASSCVAELHHDGGGAVAVAVGHDWERRRSIDEEREPDTLSVGDETLSFAVVSALFLLASHALRRSGGGRIDLASAIVSQRPVQLAQTRGLGFAERLGTWSLTELEQMTHSFALDELAQIAEELVSASYLVATDLASGFGCPEALQLTISGELEWGYVGHGFRPTIASWADQHSITVLGRD